MSTLAKFTLLLILALIEKSDNNRFSQIDAIVKCIS